jgi:hypothetical protein
LEVLLDLGVDRELLGGAAILVVAGLGGDDIDVIDRIVGLIAEPGAGDTLSIDDLLDGVLEEAVCGEVHGGLSRSKDYLTWGAVPARAKRLCAIGTYPEEFGVEGEGTTLEGGLLDKEGLLGLDLSDLPDSPSILHLE